MICPRCGTQNPDSASKCSRCGIGLTMGGDTETFAGIVPAPIPAGAGAAAPAPATIPPKPSPSIADMATAGPWAQSSSGAASGDEVNFGPRYKIQKMLGEGGMGAVYKAQDIELDRTVALKLIRPGLAMDANVAARFKQELLLASKVSHKNILRIHDLGDANGVKFISMAYVEGQDLHQVLLDHGKLPLDRALKLAKQMCSALEAAHAEGVVHRDFKPQNILLDKNEQVYVTDFGLAKSLEADAGLSRSGEFLGTPRYMAPEQVEGRGIDHRVDIYALGLILYEMLTGDVPFHADSTIQLMYKRVNEAPKSPKELNPDLPDWIVRVVMKCLERDPDNRYKNATDLLNDLQHQLAPAQTKSGTIAFTIRRVEVEMPGAKLGLLIAVAIVVIAGVITLAVPSIRHRLFGGGVESSGPHKAVTLLVADFTNYTGDPVWDGTLEPMLNTALEGASFINGYSRGDALKLAKKLPHPSEKLDQQSALLVATSQSVSAVVTGDISLRGGKYVVSAKALDAVTGNVLAQGEITVADKQDVVHELPRLAAPLRKGLGDSTPASVQFDAVSGGFRASSLEVVHQDALGLEAQHAGKFQESFDHFSKAAELDPNFARAYQGMAMMARNLGKQEDADKYFKLALQHEDQLTERERYRLRGVYYLSGGDSQKCIEENTVLVSRYPSDRAGQSNLGVCFAQLRNFQKAAEVMRRAVELVPNGALQRVNLSFYLTYTGDFPGAEREANAVLKLNPNSDIGYFALAESQIGKGDFAQAAESFKKLQGLGALGSSLAVSGLADLAAYDGRFGDAIKILDQGVAADQAAKNPDSAAEKLATIAHLQLLLGQKAAAAAAATKALSMSKSVPVRVLAAQVLIETGNANKAEKLASDLANELPVEPQAYGKMIQGEAALARGDKNAAIKLLTDANKTFDTWIGRFELGRAYVEAGQFVEADSEFDRCFKRRGEAIELFMDNVTTVAYLPPLYYLQGREREGLKNASFADSYRTYLSIRGKSAEDPLVPEIRHRLGE